MDKVCIVLNYAPHYRSNIFVEIDKKINCDFFLGNNVAGSIKKMDYSLLLNFKKEVNNKWFIKKPVYIQEGVLRLLNEDYKTFLLSGELFNLTTWMVLFLAPFYGKKVYLWSHGFYGKEGRVKRFIKKKFFNKAEGVFLYGNYAKNLMIDEGISKEKLNVIYNSLDYSKQLPLRNKMKESSVFKNKFKNTSKNLIFVGRLTKIKRLDLLIKALSILKLEGLNLNLTIIGDGVEKTTIANLIKENNLSENIWLYGACYDEFKLSELIYNADLCVSPGNVGLTAIHCLTFGTPILTHNNYSMQMPEFESIVEDETGSFFNYNDLDSLSERIKYWMLNKTDRSSIREKCYRIVDQYYNPNNQIKIFKKILSK